MQTVLGPPECEHWDARELLWAVLGVQCEGPSGRLHRDLDRPGLWLRVGSRLRQPEG